MKKTVNSEVGRKRNLIETLYRHSDLSVESIANQADMSIRQVQNVIDKIRKRDALDVLVEQSKTPIKKIMTTKVVSLEPTKTVYDASVLMTQKGVGCIVVTENGKPYGIITERDIVSGISGIDISLKNVTLEEFARRPVITAKIHQTVEEAAELMIRNHVRRLPVIKEGKIVGIVTVTDLAMFLSPTRRPGLADSILHAISRETAARKSR